MHFPQVPAKHPLLFPWCICCIVLANVNSRPSVVCLPVVGNARAPYLCGCYFRQYIYTAFGTLVIDWHPQKILRRSSEGTPPSGELNTTAVAKYSDFGPIEGYISETVQDTR